MLERFCSLVPGILFNYSNRTYSVLAVFKLQCNMYAVHIECTHCSVLLVLWHLIELFNVCLFVVVSSSDGAVLHHSWEERVKSLSERVSLAVQSGFPVYCTRIEEVPCICRLACCIREIFAWIIISQPLKIFKSNLNCHPLIWVSCISRL